MRPSGPSARQTVEEIIAAQGQRLVGWRKVPTETAKADIGPTAKAGEPHIEQLVIAAGKGLSGDAFERQLYLIRKQASHRLRGDTSLAQAKMFYVCSLSTKVIIYKGMLTTEQLFKYFPDLAAPDYTSHLAMVHSRFSTNTFPSWDRAQPMRFMSHNGEINTLRGNMNWMQARQGVVESKLFGEELSKLFPVVEPDCSDSGTFDNVLEFLLMTGRTLQESVMMMIPEAWQNHETMPEDKRAFYEYHSCLMEPWDGPASIVVHRRQIHRRRARSQRPAAVALLHHARRPRDHGQRSRRAARSSRRTSRPRAACSRAACSWSTSSKAG